MFILNQEWDATILNKNFLHSNFIAPLWCSGIARDSWT